MRSVARFLVFVAFAGTVLAQAELFSVIPSDSLMWTNAFTNGVATVEWNSNLQSGVWLPVNHVFTSNSVSGASLPTNIYNEAYYRLVTADNANVPTNMVFVPSGNILMGDGFNEGATEELPVHLVFISAFMIDQFEVTNDKMIEVLQWAFDTNKITVSAASVRNAEGTIRTLVDLDDPDCRITFDLDNGTFGMKPGKGSGYPCVEISWYGAAAFCNYRSEMEGRTPCYNLSGWSCNFSADGYRLPTEAEWEKAARGAVSFERFPWGENIYHTNANYYSSSEYSYDLSSSRGLHPTWNVNGYPLTSPVGTFAPNKFGAYDMVGNVKEWCNDWYKDVYYETSPGTDPQGPASGTSRVLRGGGYFSYARACRVSFRDYYPPASTYDDLGFRSVLPAQ